MITILEQVIMAMEYTNDLDQNRRPGTRIGPETQVDQVAKVEVLSLQLIQKEKSLQRQSRLSWPVCTTGRGT